MKDNVNQTIAYFDPFGNPPDRYTLQQIHRIMDPHKEYKLKINRLVTQPYSSDLCGLHSLLFLHRYIMSDGDFKASTGFHEKDVKHFAPFQTFIKR